MRPVLDRLRDRRYTGERRCWPCTAVNAVIVVAGAALVRRRSRALAGALALAGSLAIALRGYAVPYTPAFAPRLAARLPGDLFRKAAAPARSGEPRAPPDSLAADESEAEAGEAVLAALLDAGVVAADGETLSLDEQFRDAWRTEMTALRAGDERGLAEALRDGAPGGTSVDVVEREDRGLGDRDAKRWFVVSDGSGDPANERWLTRPVAVAEVAAVRALADWTDLSPARRARAAGPLRTLLEACPVCDGPVEETTTMQCCGGPGGARPDAVDDVLACRDCEARLYTFG